jgi:predicted dehydrogenase
MDIGGGRIIGEVCHFIDTCAYLTDSHVVSLACRCVRQDDRSIPEQDNVHIALSFADGSIATIGYFAYGNKMVPKEFIEIMGNDLTMQMNDFRSLVIYERSRRKKISCPAQDKGFKAEFEAFRSGVKDGKSPVPFESVYNTALSAFKILESLKTDASIEL